MGGAGYEWHSWLQADAHRAEMNAMSDHLQVWKNAHEKLCVQIENMDQDMIRLQTERDGLVRRLNALQTERDGLAAQLKKAQLDYERVRRVKFLAGR